MKSILQLCLVLASLAGPTLASAKEVNLVQNPGFETVDPTTSLPANYDVQGAATYGLVGRQEEFTTHGIIFHGNAAGGGSVSQTITGIDQSKGKWLTFRFHGLAEDKFKVDNNDLAMKIDFFSKGGTNHLDGITRLIYREIENDRRDLATNGLHRVHGAEVWRGYELEELLPFPEVDTVKITVIYEKGTAASDEDSSFYIDDFSLVQRKVSLTGKVDPAEAHPATPPAPPVDESKLISLGGRWYYEPLPGETVPTAPGAKSPGPLTVTDENVDRLFYKSDRMITPFVGSMTAWMRAGFKDEQGNVVTKDRFVPDNVVILFKGDGFITIKSKGIPNHPTAQFPDTFGTQNYSPSYIQAFDRTSRLPLEPVLDPDAKSVVIGNGNSALPMGPVGIMVNGVVFYNPFDMNDQDAADLVDRCCGHPSPDNVYHYHKYPVCVNTPFVDKGDGPSEVIGFAFDGLPVYGPYSEAGVMAKDSTTHPLNAFNICYDPVRGWHYHVTPGKFPYIIGGFYAKPERSNFGHSGIPSYSMFHFNPGSWFSRPPPPPGAPPGPPPDAPSRPPPGPPQ